MRGATEKLTNELQNSAGEAMDMSSIQEDLDKMTESVSSLANMSGSIDASRFTNAYMENMQNMYNIGRKLMRFDLLSGGMTSYMTFIRQMTSAYTEFASEAGTACMPSSRAGPRL